MAGRLYLEQVFGVYFTVNAVSSLLLVCVQMRAAFHAFADARFPTAPRRPLPKSPAPLHKFFKSTNKKTISSDREQVDSLPILINH
jgi:hypothetical protein